MGKNGRKRIWKLAQQTAFNCGRGRNKNKTNKLSIKNKIKEKIKTKIKASITEKKTQKKIDGLTGSDLNSALNCFPNFLGCVPEDKLDELVFGSLPCFIIVNIDTANMPGSHWIVLGIFKKSIEIFDPLGFDIFNWSRVPCNLLNFVHRLSVTRDLKLAQRIQSDSSTLCGYFCLFYMFMRKHTCLNTILSYFDSKFSCNDSILLKFFS